MKVSTDRPLAPLLAVLSRAVSWRSFLIVGALVGFSLLVAKPLKTFAADQLKLRDGISFVQDTDTGFPILGERMDDVTVESGKSAVIFFGASGDLNTNRQAKRIVDAYNKYAGKLKFIIIDVDRPVNAEATKLVKTYYKGYIPFEVIIGKSGSVSWSKTGEVDGAELKTEIEKVI